MSSLTKDCGTENFGQDGERAVIDLLGSVHLQATRELYSLEYNMLNINIKLP